MGMQVAFASMHPQSHYLEDSWKEFPATTQGLGTSTTEQTPAPRQTEHRLLGISNLSLDLAWALALVAFVADETSTVHIQEGTCQNTAGKC